MCDVKKISMRDLENGCEKKSLFLGIKHIMARGFVAMQIEVKYDNVAVTNGLPSSSGVLNGVCAQKSIVWNYISA